MTDARPYIQHMASSLMTADELTRLNLPGKRAELVRGRLVVREPAGFRHGVAAMRLAVLIAQIAKDRDLGLVVAAETGFILSSDPDTVRAPDVAFIRHERIPDPLPRGYAGMAPDLVVEVMSPTDRAGQILAKVADWLGAGSQLVWVLDPERRQARVYRADGTESLIADDDVLDGEETLPGFTCRLSALL